MKHRTSGISIALCTLLFAAAPVAAGAAKEGYPFSESLDNLTLANGRQMHFDLGIGSGAFHRASDPADIIYTITDRGPNVDMEDAQDILATDYGTKSGKVFPVPNFCPTICKLSVKDGRATIVEKIQIKTADGRPVSGISNPDTEPAWDINGKALPSDPSGLDAEGLVLLADGTFWVGEEYGPSVSHLAADGRVLERWVPARVKASLAGAGYPIKEALPAILRQRPLNRGIESMAVSPDQKFLYFAMQSPLANPDKDAYKKSRNLRIFKIDRSAGAVVGEYVYLIDTPDTFGKDNSKKKPKQNDVKVSELTGVGTDRLVVLERISATTKFYLVDLAQAENILGSKWDDAATSPSLEQSDPAEIKPLAKHLLLNSDDRGGMIKKIEGVAWLGKDSWLMLNDNDFGIEGDSTFVAPVKMEISAE